MNTYKRLGIDLLATGGTDIRVKTRLSDSTAGFLDEKLTVNVSGKLTKTLIDPFGNELIELDVNEANIDHDLLLNFEADEHREQNDALTSTTTLWSSQKTQDELDGKINQISPVADNRLVKSVGTTGVDVEQTGLTVDDSDNVTGINDLTVSGNLTVNGTTTTVNSDTLEVTDPNITVNNNGTQASANLATAGVTVEMSDATDAVIGYDSTLASKFKAGEAGDLREVITSTHTQSLTNKTINADNNTISELEVDNFKAGVVDTDMDTGVNNNTSVPTTLAVETYIANNVVSDTFTSKVSLNDTTPEFLEDKLTSSDSTITINTLNDGADESLDLIVEETNVDHDALLNYVANEHVDHTSVLINTNADSGLTGGGDISASRTLSVDISGTTAETSLEALDELLVYDVSAGALRKVTRGNLLAGLPVASTGDINETSFAITNNTITATDITGFLFNNANVRSFEALVSVEIDATADLFESVRILGIQKGSGWEIALSSVGDTSDVVFTITASGQLQYTCANYAGFVSGSIKFRAITTSV